MSRSDGRGYANSGALPLGVHEGGRLGAWTRLEWWGRPEGVGLIVASAGFDLRLPNLTAGATMQGSGPYMHPQRTWSRVIRDPERTSTVQIQISTRHGHLSDETKRKFTEKLERLPRFFERVTAVVATVDLGHEERPTVELRLSAERVDDFVAIEHAETLMGALDGVVQKMEQQLRKQKEKWADHRTEGRRNHALAPEQVVDADEEN